MLGTLVLIGEAVVLLYQVENCYSTESSSIRNKIHNLNDQFVKQFRSRGLSIQSLYIYSQSALPLHCSREWRP